MVSRDQTREVIDPLIPFINEKKPINQWFKHLKCGYFLLICSSNSIHIHLSFPKILVSACSVHMVSRSSVTWPHSGSLWNVKQDQDYFVKILVRTEKLVESVASRNNELKIPPDMCQKSLLLSVWIRGAPPLTGSRQTAGRVDHCTLSSSANRYKCSFDLTPML